MCQHIILGPRKFCELVTHLDLGATEHLGGTGTLLLERAEAAREDGLTDEGHGLAKVEGVDGSPLAGTLLSSAVHPGAL